MQPLHRTSTIYLGTAPQQSRLTLTVIVACYRVRRTLPAPVAGVRACVHTGRRAGGRSLQSIDSLWQCQPHRIADAWLSLPQCAREQPSNISLPLTHRPRATCVSTHISSSVLPACCHHPPPHCALTAGVSLLPPRPRVRGQPVGAICRVVTTVPSRHEPVTGCACGSHRCCSVVATASRAAAAAIAATARPARFSAVILALVACISVVIRPRYRHTPSTRLPG